MRHRLSAIACLLVPIACYPFESNGIFSGMSDEQALRVLRARSSRVVPLQNRSGEGETYIASGPGSASETLSICRGKVSAYQYDVSGGLASFVRMVERETTASGAGASEVFSRETSAGEWSSLKFRWSGNTEVKELCVSVVAGGKEQVYVRYEVSDSACSAGT